MKHVLLLSFLVAFSCLKAQPKMFKTTKEAHAFAEEMVKLITTGNAKEAFTKAKAYWPLDEFSIDGLAETTGQQIPMLQENFGPLSGYEFIRSESVGTCGHLEIFMIKYRDSALRFYLVFYNGGSGWQINALRWDDNWDTLFTTRLDAGDN